MSFPKVEEARKLSDQELSEKILDLKKNLANLRLLQATGRLEKPHEFRHTKHQLAQLLTVEHERKHQAEKEVIASETPADASAVATTEEE